MSITAYVGNPGSGKSYSVIKQCREWVKEGRLVVSNIPLTDKGRAQFGELYVEYPKDKPPSCGWADFWKNYPGAILVIDEPWRYWPTGLKANDMPEPERSLFAEHRHYTRNGVSSDIVLVTQSLSDIASFPRGKVDSTFVISALVQVGQPNRFRMDIYSGVFTGKEGGGCVKLREIYGKHESSVWDLYRSNTNSAESGQVRLTDKRASLLNSAVIWFGIPAGVILFLVVTVWFFKRHTNLAETYGVKPVADQAAVSSGTDRAAVRSGADQAAGAGGALRGNFVVGEIGPYVVLADGLVVESSRYGCLHVLGSLPSALPVCSRPLPGRRVVPIVAQN